MAMDQSALLELLEALKAAGVDERVRIAAQSMYQALIDAEAEGVIGAGFWERSEARTAVRNGSRPRTVVTPAVVDGQAAVFLCCFGSCLGGGAFAQ